MSLISEISRSIKQNKTKQKTHKEIPGIGEPEAIVQKRETIPRTIWNISWASSITPLMLDVM